MVYIATFYSHFGAVRYRKLCDGRRWSARLAPVPRALSSSCGTCVCYEGDSFCPVETVPEEVEQIVQVSGDGFIPLFRAQNG